ncbi:hypothetical protein [Myxococcus qinghaiensis]|uniref:hypothetical protein n=1 Tax=Myxococcus qinghaiensis TaxID=2906758 RepID=UPI0020A77EEE|nr:hypothetical protein [Myxococcus qinghaiensis]MCP3162614.1 hypothetical protein [Myxococcus qinghaiensis]
MANAQVHPRAVDAPNRSARHCSRCMATKSRRVARVDLQVRCRDVEHLDFFEDVVPRRSVIEVVMEGTWNEAPLRDAPLQSSRKAFR